MYDELVKRLHKRIALTTAGSPLQDDLRQAADAIKELSKRARPVVLCKDCDCWNDWDSSGRESLGNYVCSCAHWSVEDGPILYTRPTDFCSYGERMEES